MMLCTRMLSLTTWPPLPQQHMHGISRSIWTPAWEGFVEPGNDPGSTSASFCPDRAHPAGAGMADPRSIRASIPLAQVTGAPEAGRSLAVWRSL